MDLIEAVEVMKTGKIVISEIGVEYKLDYNELLFRYKKNTWVKSISTLIELCDKTFTVKDESTLIDKIFLVPARRDSNTPLQVVVSVDDLKNTIKLIKENLYNLNYHEDCVSEVIETIDKHLGAKFKD